MFIQVECSQQCAAPYGMEKYRRWSELAPKGMKAVVEERDVDTKRMKAANKSRGHLCVFYPKYHCELCPIELVLCLAKNIHMLIPMG